MITFVKVLKELIGDQHALWSPSTSLKKKKIIVKKNKKYNWSPPKNE
jgi:hypothetical protein